jgi:glycosyltransferase involved in cell wall biosynthesis
MTTLMVTPYPPYRDGIGTYAVQEVKRMRAAGKAVEVLSPLPSAADHHLALGGLRGVLALVRRASRYESVIVQFSPEMFFGGCHGPLERVAVWAGIEALARSTRLEIRLHEIEFGPLRRNPVERVVAARALRASVVSVHTRAEITNLERTLGLDPSRISLVEHGQNFAMATTMSREEARAELGLDPVEHVFLSIGFLQEHKGFDNAARAFARADVIEGASLHIVGSVRVDHPDLMAYARRLGQLCHTTPGVTLHQKYVSDEEFDRWIVAADTVVLPYREIWSSSVMERAKLYRRPIIAADVGGMGDQAPEGTLLFDDDESLIQAMKERFQTTVGRLDQDSDSEPGSGARSSASSADGGGWDVDPEHPDRSSIEAQIRARVRRHALDGTGPGASSLAAGSAVDPLVAVGPLHRPQAVSARPGVSQVKRMIRRITNWEVDPLASHLVSLQRAMIEAVADLEARIEARERPDDEADDPT